MFAKVEFCLEATVKAGGSVCLSALIKSQFCSRLLGFLTSGFVFFLVTWPGGRIRVKREERGGFPLGSESV